MKSIVLSTDYPLPSHDYRGYISVHFTGVLREDDFEKLSLGIYQGKTFTQIREEEVKAPDLEDWDLFLELREKYEQAIQVSISFGVVPTEGDLVSTGIDGEELLQVIKRIPRFYEGRFILIYILVFISKTYIFCCVCRSV